MRRLVRTLAWTVVAALLAACSGGDGAPEGASAVGGRLTVFAAASLTDAFNDIAAAFEAEHRGVEVSFNFGGSPTLRVQLEQGARADVYASADVNQMRLAREGGLIDGEPVVFARNTLVLVTPKRNPGAIESLGDLRRPGLKLVLAAAEVPAGGYAREALASAEADPAYGRGFAEAVLRNVVSLESNVKQVVAKVELGAADAGIVYATDVTPSLAARLRTVEIPQRFNVVAAYPIGVTKEASNRRAARAFVDFVLSKPGQAFLAKYGFRTAG